jgi:hypothetical protein
MWCSIDMIDVPAGPDLKSDAQWGWIHRTDGRWHTVLGTFLEEKGGRLVPVSISIPELPDID